MKRNVLAILFPCLRALNVTDQSKEVKYTAISKKVFGENGER